MKFDNQIFTVIFKKLDSEIEEYKDMFLQEKKYFTQKEIVITVSNSGILRADAYNKKFLKIQDNGDSIEFSVLDDETINELYEYNIPKEISVEIEDFRNSIKRMNTNMTYLFSLNNNIEFLEEKKDELLQNDSLSDTKTLQVFNNLAADIYKYFKERYIGYSEEVNKFQEETIDKLLEMEEKKLDEYIETLKKGKPIFEKHCKKSILTALDNTLEKILFDLFSQDIDFSELKDKSVIEQIKKSEQPITNYVEKEFYYDVFFDVDRFKPLKFKNQRFPKP